jgi:hypothetical protein
MSAPPILYEWQGDCMKPVGRFAKECDRLFVVGERYKLAEHADRSQASHNHYFAAIAEAWANLPEREAERHLTAEHLRKYALIKSGYADQEDFVAGSKAEAVRLATALRKVDGYSVVTISGCVVTRWTAKTQRMNAMGRKDFQESKQAVLDYVAGLVGVSPDELSSNAQRAA